jgi:hypothetical protein
VFRVCRQQRQHDAETDQVDEDREKDDQERRLSHGRRGAREAAADGWFEITARV